MVPLVDCRDGDYLVYDFSGQIYSMYNHIDELSFRDYQTLNDFVQKKYKLVMEGIPIDED